MIWRKHHNVFERNASLRGHLFEPHGVAMNELDQSTIGQRAVQFILVDRTTFHVSLNKAASYRDLQARLGNEAWNKRRDAVCTV
jgi:hypothetical protein